MTLIKESQELETFREEITRRCDPQQRVEGSLQKATERGADGATPKGFTEFSNTLGIHDFIKVFTCSLLPWTCRPLSYWGEGLISSLTIR